MSYTEQYKGHKWIKVPHLKLDPELSDFANLMRLDSHHIAETTFLIEEVRRLAALLDGVTNALEPNDDRPSGTDHVGSRSEPEA